MDEPSSKNCLGVLIYQESVVFAALPLLIPLKRSLEKEGWKITHDPLPVSFELGDQHLVENVITNYEIILTTFLMFLALVEVDRLPKMIQSAFLKLLEHF